MESGATLLAAEVSVADEEKPIKVSDFRMFTPDGELKPEYRDLETASADAPAPEPPKAQAPPPPPPPPAAPPPSPEPGPGDQAAPGAAEPDFVDLVRSLATSAYAALGLLSEPGVPSAQDLPGARRLIDWLSLLERKTRSNLSFAEQDLLTRALYELRMAYVEASGAAAAPPSR
jgi:hypothetical protein